MSYLTKNSSKLGSRFYRFLYFFVSSFLIFCRCSRGVGVSSSCFVHWYKVQPLYHLLPKDGQLTLAEAEQLGGRLVLVATQDARERTVLANKYDPLQVRERERTVLAKKYDPLKVRESGH